MDQLDDDDQAKRDELITALREAARQVEEKQSAYTEAASDLDAAIIKYNRAGEALNGFVSDVVGQMDNAQDDEEDGWLETVVGGRFSDWYEKWSSEYEGVPELECTPDFTVEAVDVDQIEESLPTEA
jgi:hypothetical protein